MVVPQCMSGTIKEQSNHRHLAFCECRISHTNQVVARKNVTPLAHNLPERRRLGRGRLGAPRKSVHTSCSRGNGWNARNTALSVRTVFFPEFLLRSSMAYYGGSGGKPLLCLELGSEGCKGNRALRASLHPRRTLYGPVCTFYFKNVHRRTKQTCTNVYALS